MLLVIDAADNRSFFDAYHIDVKRTQVRLRRELLNKQLFDWLLFTEVFHLFCILRKLGFLCKRPTRSIFFFLLLINKRFYSKKGKLKKLNSLKNYHRTFKRSKNSTAELQEIPPIIVQYSSKLLKKKCSSYLVSSLSTSLHLQKSCDSSLSRWST